MRTFSYDHNGGAEYFISVLADNNELIAKISFPTPSATKEFFQRDIDKILTNKALPVLTAEETAACRKIINDNLPS